MIRGLLAEFGIDIPKGITHALAFVRRAVAGGAHEIRRQIMPAIEHRSHKGLNNRAENSHVPLRKCERAMQGFRSPGGLQRFVAIFSAVRNLFVPPRSRRCALATHLHRLDAMAHWKAVAGAAA